MASVWERLDGAEELLAKRWREGVSASAIAEMIGGGLTKNAIIGKAKRLGLAPHTNQHGKGRRKPRRKSQPSAPAVLSLADLRGSSQKADERKRAAEEALERMAKAARVPEAEVDLPGISFEYLGPRDCRFAISDNHAGPREHRFCGAPVVEGRSWCREHLRRVFGSARVNMPKRGTGR